MTSLVKTFDIALVCCAIFSLITAENALSDAELSVLQANGFTITKHESDSTITIEHHGYPNHTFDGGWGDNPNTAIMVNHSYNLPLEATVAASEGCATSLGVIGLAISGAAFYNPYTGFGWNAVEGECAETLDNCWGHPSPDGTYHYHRIPSCLYTEPYEDKFLGVALDGYPIYGPMDATGKTWTSAELDVCHGHTYLGRYIYRATFDFPYILSCFHGQDVKNGENGRRRRDVSNHVYRRQAPPGIPPGLDNDPCWHAENAQWQQLSCFVVCQNAGSDLSNCPVSDLAASPSVATMGVIYMVMAYFCI